MTGILDRVLRGFQPATCAVNTQGPVSDCSHTAAVPLKEEPASSNTANLTETAFTGGGPIRAPADDGDGVLPSIRTLTGDQHLPSESRVRQMLDIRQHDGAADSDDLNLHDPACCSGGKPGKSGTRPHSPWTLACPIVRSSVPGCPPLTPPGTVIVAAL
jgi:hypothetical protein